MGNREKLLEIACVAFGQKGYEATSVDDLLAEADVSPSNFYYHFRSKEDLALEVLQAIFARTRDKFAPLYVNRGIPAREKLEQLHALFVQRMERSRCSGGCPMGNLAAELADVNSRFRECIASFFGECMDGIEGIVRQGIQEGAFREDLEPRASAALLFGSLEGLMLVSKCVRDIAPLDRGFRQALELLKKARD
jgi:TetR/AcrR family transcriptional regulator, transcriptional repressor for nem operon